MKPLDIVSWDLRIGIWQSGILLVRCDTDRRTWISQLIHGSRCMLAIDDYGLRTDSLYRVGQYATGLSLPERIKSTRIDSNFFLDVSHTPCSDAARTHCQTHPAKYQGPCFKWAKIISVNMISFWLLFLAFKTVVAQTPMTNVNMELWVPPSRFILTTSNYEIRIFQFVHFMNQRRYKFIHRSSNKECD